MTGAIIRLLSKIGFKQAIHDFVYKHQSSDYKEHMQFAFIDSGGRKYYYFPDLKKLPLPLLEKLTELQEQLRAKIPGDDLDRWIQAVEKCLNNGGKMTDVGYWLGVMKDRRSILFDPSILTEIAALLYIREDENANVYNREIHKQKFEMIWESAKDGNSLYDFFHKAGLSSYIPSQSISGENWMTYLEDFNQKAQKFNSAISRILKSALESGALTNSSQKT